MGIGITDTMKLDQAEIRLVPVARHLDTLVGVTDPGMCLLAQEGLESESC